MDDLPGPGYGRSAHSVTCGSLVPISAAGPGPPLAQAPGMEREKYYPGGWFNDPGRDQHGWAAGYGTSLDDGRFAAEYSGGFADETDMPARAGGERRVSGRFGGAGPRNWRRPDQRIHEEVCERLTADPFVDASDIEVEVDGGEVHLRGTVGERWIKRRAEAVAEAVHGVADVYNEIRLRRP